MIEPDAGMLRQHVGHLFDGWLDGCHEAGIELAWTDGGDRKLRHAAIFGTDELDQLVERAVVENGKPGQNVYIGQALRKPDIAKFSRCGDDEFFALTTFYVDIDDDVTASAANNYRRRSCPTTGVVITGRHPHVRAQLLWRLESPVRDPEACRRQNLMLAMTLGGDTSVVNPSRVLRLGGSIAWPTKEGRVLERTEFLSFKDGRPKAYLAEQIAMAFPPTRPEQKFSSSQPSSAPSSTKSSRASAVKLDIGTTNLSVDVCIACIRAGDHWHDNLVRLTGHWISRGWSDAEIVMAAQALTLPGYRVTDTCREVEQMIAGARVKWNVPNPTNLLNTSSSVAPLQPNFLHHLNVSMLPTRRWVLDRSLLRGHLTLLVAPAGAGKSTHGIARAVAVTTGRDLTDEPIHESTTCWVYNTEDDSVELKRRLGAVLQHWSIPFEEVRGRIALNSGADRKLVFARADRSGMVIRLPDVDACIEHIRNHNLGLFIVDPFVETHEVNENSNEQIKSVAIMFREVARATNCAVLLVHHTAKPPQGVSDGHAGNMNTARGASALVGVARVVQTLFSMSEKDAEYHSVLTKDRHLFLRLDDAKANLGLISPDAKWFRKVGVEIANGDEVGLLVPHQFEKRSSWFSTDTAVEILKIIDERWRAKNPFSASAQSGRYVVPVMVQRFGLTRNVAKSLLANWIANEMVRTETIDSHDKLRGLRVVAWPG